MKRLLGLLAGLGAVGAPVAGFCCPPRVVSYQQQQQQTYVAPVAAYAVPLVVPHYSATYTPAPEQPPPAAAPAGGDDATAAIRELSEAVRQLRAELAQMRGAAGLPPGAQAMPQAVTTPDTPAVAMLRVACASCHTADKNPKGNLAMFATAGSAPTPLNPAQQRKVLSKVASGEMPKSPRPPLSDAQRKLIAQWVESLP